MNWILSAVIIVVIFSLIYWALREHHTAGVLRKENETLRNENSELRTEKSKLSDSVRQKGTELSGAQNRIKRLQKELDEK